MARSRWLLILLLFASCWGASARASDRDQEEGPRLVLPGSHAVHPGQEIALAWTPDAAVTELEILLSLDGGRTYPIWISPRLSPRACRFVWRVPRYAARSVRMRIRFNRGGREIEGAPTASLDVVPAGATEPLGLPASSGEPARAPRPGSENHATRAAWTAPPARPPRPYPSFRAFSSPTTTPVPSRRAESPRFVPLRA